jgi:tripartite-type tricarboxylate transporter receptor subunit TctC
MAAKVSTLAVRAASFVLCLGLMGGATPAAAQSVADFYKGKTVTYIVATTAGGGYDSYARLVIEFMQKHMPGTTYVIKNMPGAGHILGANALYAAKPDGLTIGTFNTGLVYAQLVKQNGVRFDLTKMSWVGKASSDPKVFVVDAKSDVKTFEDLRNLKETKNMAEGGVGSGSYAESSMLIEALKLNLKIIVGYRGEEDKMAIRRGEALAAMGARSTMEPVAKAGYVRMLFQIGGSEKDLPQLDALVNDPEVKAITALMRSQSDVARFTAGPPNIPKDRLDHLIATFRAAMEDPAMHEKAAKFGRPVDPAYGETVLNYVKAALDQSPSMVTRMTKALDLKPPEMTANGAMIEVKDDGRIVVFSVNGESVTSKISSSRSKIRVADMDATGKHLQSGMKCDITYVPGDNNEPTTIICP